MTSLLRRAALLLALSAVPALALVPSDAQACGLCHGDKIAIVYDHATVTKAVKEGKAVEFADVEGDFMNQGPEGIAFMKKAVASVRGVQADTVKVSSNPTAVAFVFDPKHGTPTDFLKRINARLASKKWTLTHLRVIDAQHP